MLGKSDTSLGGGGEQILTQYCTIWERGNASQAMTLACSGTSLLDQLGDVVGAVDDLPADLAENHDHYLYGTPKRR